MNSCELGNAVKLVVVIRRIVALGDLCGGDLCGGGGGQKLWTLYVQLQRADDVWSAEDG